MAVDAAPPWRARERAIEDLLPGSMSHDRDLLLARLEEYARAVIATVRAERESGSCTPVRECMWLERPVFICGAHRSGTTLMQSLLDGHPELIVLPSEGTYLTSFAYAARERPSVGDVDRFIAEWIARLIDPNDSPHFKLGRSTEERNPAIDFCRALLYWHSRLQAAPSSHARFNLLLALAAAYLAAVAPTATPRMWVEKTPLNENYAPLLLRSFSQARFIQMIRDPSATFASHHAAYVAEGIKGFDRLETLHAIQPSLRLAARNLRQFTGCYLVVRYEDLTDNLAQEMERVCEFLGIRTDPILTTPTAGGVPVRSNSSFTRSPPGVVAARRGPDISEDDAKLVAALVGAEARRWGYSVARLGLRDTLALQVRSVRTELFKRPRRWVACATSVLRRWRGSAAAPRSPLG
jgi:hypothetical protein